VSPDLKIQNAEKTASSLWVLGGMAAVIFSAGWSAHVFMSRDVVRYGDPVTLVVDYGSTEYQVNANMSDNDKRLFLAEAAETEHTFRIGREP
jgi:hypothetical protein